MTAKHRTFFVFLSLAILAIFVGGCVSLAEDITPPPGYQPPTAPPTEPEVNNVYPMVSPDVDNGALLYTEKCAPCHGATGLGDGPQAGELPNPVPPLASIDVALAASPQYWYKVIRQGNIERYMPPFASLTERQVWDVIAYVYSLSNTPDLVSQGGELYQQNCAACHGKNGEGIIPGARVLNDQEFMAGMSALDLMGSIRNGIGEMPPFAQFSDDDLIALTAYIRSFTFPVPVSGGESVTQVQATPTLESPATTETEETTNTASLDATPTVNPNPSEGALVVQILNANELENIDSLSAVIYGYDHMTEAYSTTVAFSADGTAKLANVPMPEGRMFQAAVDYGGVTYGSNIGIVETEPTTITLQMSLYDTTTDASVLQIDRLHIFFEFPEPDIVQVVELFVISNPSGKTVVSPEPGEPAVRFALPEGASNLRFQDGEIGQRYVITEEGFGDTLGVPPTGEPYQVLFAFDLPYEKNKVNIEQKLLLDTAAVILLAPDDGVDVESDQLTYSGSQAVEGVNYGLYTSESIPSGGILSVRLSGQPRFGGTADMTAPDSHTNLIIGLGALGLVLIVVGLLLYRRQKSIEEQIEEEEEFIEAEENGDVDEDPQALMDAIIALDDLYQAGDLPEDAYMRRRNALKERLQALMDVGDNLND